MMRLLLGALGLALVTVASCQKDVGALYAMTNDPEGNRVLIFNIHENGTLSYKGWEPTLGFGLTGIHVPVLDTPGTLFSQGAVTVQGEYLYVINPGDDTLSAFHIDPKNPNNITLIGKPIHTDGEFPVSVDALDRTKTACVFNGGAVNGVACFKLTKTGLKKIGKTYYFGLNETTPVHGPPGSLSHVLFSEDGKVLRAAIKGLPGGRNGFIAQWNVTESGELSEHFVNTYPPADKGLIVFGMANIPNNPKAVLATDPLLGATIYDWSHYDWVDNNSTRFIPLVIPGQEKNCWAVYAPNTQTYWMTDLGVVQTFVATIDEKTLQPTYVGNFSLGVGYNVTDLAVATVGKQDYVYVISPHVTTWNIYAAEANNGSYLYSQYNFGAEITDFVLVPNLITGSAVFMTEQ